MHLQITVPCLLDRIRRHQQRNFVDSHIRARTCIRACNRLPHELPSQTWPSLKSFLVFYFSLDSFFLFCMCKSDPFSIYLGQGLIISYYLFSFSLVLCFNLLRTRLPMC